MNGIIYKAISPSGKIYIGQTCESLTERKFKHKSDSSRKVNNYAFHCAIRKYGFENIKWEIIMENLPSKTHMDMWERLFIHLENSNDSKFGYNMTIGGDHSPMLGRNHTIESRQKMSKSLIGRNAWNKGLTKEDPRVAKNLEGGKKTQFKSGNLANIKQCSEAGKMNKGKKKPPRTQEHKEKLSLSKRGSKLSEETKRKQSESQKLRWTTRNFLKFITN